MPPPPTVAAVPLALLDFRRRTFDPDDWARAAAAPLDDALVAAGGSGGLGVAVAGHLRRSEALGATTAFVGLSLLLAGGAVGAVALALLSAGPTAGLDVDAAGDLLAGVLRGPDVEPYAVAALAALLGRDVIAGVARTRPLLVGPVDGMPIELRYEANRAIALASDDEAIRRLGAPGRQLLYIDPARGYAAEVLGDLLAADHVAVVVPGMANRIAAFDTVLDKAEALRRAAAALDPPADVATIAWLGYDSPLLDVVLDDAAVAGAPNLVRFVDGLAASGVAAGTTRTVVAHSYGTVVAGAALRRGLEVDAVAVTGSPGLGAGTARQLGDTPIYALRAPGDYIGWSEAFGTDPSDADFGAVRLDTGDVVGHDGYFDDGTESLRSLALVTASRADEAAVLEPSPADRDDPLDRLDIDLPIDIAQRALGFLDANPAFEAANRGVDVAQRVLSVDFQRDVIEDAWRWITR